MAPEADFEARVDWVLVRQHYELLVLAQGRGVDVLVFVRDVCLFVVLVSVWFFKFLVGFFLSFWFW